MDVQALTAIVRVRLAEHATAVRTKAKNQEVELKPLDEFYIRSAKMFKEANQTARFKAITMAPISQTIDGCCETVAGDMQSKPKGVNPNGEVKTIEGRTKQPKQWLRSSV